MHTEKNSHKKGVALFIALALLFLLSVTAAVVLLSAYNHANISENQIKRLKAISSAEAGINYAYWKMRTDPDYPSTHTDELTADVISPGANGHDVKIWIESVSGRNAIRSKVTY